MKNYINKLTDSDLKEIIKMTDSPFTIPVDLATNLQDKKGNKINPIKRSDTINLICIIPDEKNIRKKVVCNFSFNDFGCTTLSAGKFKITENYSKFLCSQMTNVFYKYCSKKFGLEYTNYISNHSNKPEQTLEM